MRSEYFLAILATFLLVPAYAGASERCASSIGELRAMLGDQNLPLHWQEFQQENAKPFVVDIQEWNGGLLLAISKPDEGIMVESRGMICRIGSASDNRFVAEQVRPGPAASWFLRQAISPRENFTLTRIGTNQLRIVAGVWGGHFGSVETMP